jgi:pimeloyl-ACP methyl ester carboxylesterase
MGRWYHAKREKVKGAEPGGAMTKATRTVSLRTGAEIEVWTDGANIDEPPLVLLPGVGGSKELLGRVFELFAHDRRVVAMDLSPLFERRVSVLESSVRDVLEAVDALGLGEFDLLGQSFGALVATRVTRARPDHVRKLILAGPAVIPSSWAAPAIFARWLGAGTLIRFCPRSLRPQLARLVRCSGGFPIEPELEGEGFEDLVTRIQILRVLPWVRRMFAVRAISWRTELEGIEAPVLVIEGAREAALLPTKLIVFFDQRPNTKYVEMPGGHMPFLVRPEDFVKLVNDFLNASHGLVQQKVEA